MVKITSEMKIKQFAKVIGVKEDHKVYDVTREFGTAESLTEARINCLVVSRRDFTSECMCVLYRTSFYNE